MAVRQAKIATCDRCGKQGEPDEEFARLKSKIETKTVEHNEKETTYLVADLCRGCAFEALNRVSRDWSHEKALMIYGLLDIKNREETV